jgi:hypothetical protein
MDFSYTTANAESVDDPSETVMATHEDDDEETEDGEIVESLEDVEIGDPKAQPRREETSTPDEHEESDEDSRSVPGDNHDGAVSGTRTEPHASTDGSPTPKSDEPKDAEDEGEELHEQAKMESVYSTRGRTADRDPDPLERLARDALGELAREKEPSASHSSFLSDSLTEEERRTRTRYLPEVEGLHALRKHEVKGDLSLARTLQPVPGKKSKRTEDAMDEDGGLSPMEDSTDANRRVVTIAGHALPIPSPAFVAPLTEATVPSARVVGSVTAFNPPQPPESVSAKYKHRMLRWENHPSEIQVDLTKYRKTVQKARSELHKAMAERERVETVQDHLRRHFFQHIDCLNAEWRQLQGEFHEIQQECVDAADLLTSRTRSRGAGKSSHVMRDVLQVLRSRGAEIQTKSLDLHSIPTSSEPALRGMGGVGLRSFLTWDRSTVIAPAPAAAAWLLAGDAVETPCGPGTVQAVYPPGDALEKGGDADKIPDNQPSEGLTGPRVAVQLPFGIGYFPLDAVMTKENPAAYDDARLAQRWKGLMETATAVGSVLDLESMATTTNDGTKKEESVDGMDESGSNVESKDDMEESTVARRIPFGAGMLPIGTARGHDLYKRKLADLENDLDKPLYEGEGVLGFKDNKNVPTATREAEDLRQERIDLEAKLHHLKNKVYRQRTIRILNERTYAGAQERSTRVKSLITEMRMDLMSLRSRLDDEVRELGITGDQAEAILTSFYRSLDSQHSGEASPPKRQRRAQDDLDDDEEMASAQAGSTDVASDSGLIKV